MPFRNFFYENMEEKSITQNKGIKYDEVRI